MSKKKTSDVGSFDISTLLIPPLITKKEEDYDKHDIKWQKAKRFAEDTAHRKGLIFWVKCVVTGSLILTFSILFLNRAWCMDISDTVLVALLTTTTANILGLAFIVLRGMFNVKENQD